MLIKFDTDHVMYHVPQDNQIKSLNLTVEEEFLSGTNCKLSSFEASNCNKKDLVCLMKEKTYGEL